MASEDKKLHFGPTSTTVEDVSSPDKLHATSSRDDTDSFASILEASNRIIAERKLVRKLDSRLLPMIVLIFIMNYIDVRVTFILFNLPDALMI